MVDKHRGIPLKLTAFFFNRLLKCLLGSYYLEFLSSVYERIITRASVLGSNNLGNKNLENNNQGTITFVM